MGELARITLVDRGHRAVSEQRRSIRAELKVPLLVRWAGPGGAAKQETRETRVVNAHGCLLLLKAPVFEGMTLELVNRNTNAVHPGRVVCCGAIEPDGRTQVGVELDRPDDGFWGEQYVDFLRWLALRKA